MLEFLISGALLGLAAGFSPGPLLVLVIQASLNHSTKEGLKVSLVPIITDAPIILLTLFVVAELSGISILLGVISLVGGGFVCYLGWESFRTRGLDLKDVDADPKSVKKGMAVNFLSPHPYMFWFLVGSPIIFKAYEDGLFKAIAFVAVFYFCLVGSKMLVAILFGKARSFITGKPYIYIMRTLGVLLFIFSILLFRDGLKLIGLLAG